MGKDLQISDGDIKNTLNEEGNNTYTFSVCGMVENPPQVCKDEKEKAASCFQTDGDFRSCHNCGTFAEPGEFTRIQKNNGDFEDWSKGVQLTYEGGSKCNHGGSPNRKTILQVGCRDVRCGVYDVGCGGSPSRKRFLPVGSVRLLGC